MIQLMIEVQNQDQWLLLSLRNAYSPLRQKRGFNAQFKLLLRQNQAKEPVRVYIESNALRERYYLKIIENDQICAMPRYVSHNLQDIFRKIAIFSIILLDRRLLVRIEKGWDTTVFAIFSIGVSSQIFYNIFFRISLDKSFNIQYY